MSCTISESRSSDADCDIVVTIKDIDNGTINAINNSNQNAVITSDVVFLVRLLFLVLQIMMLFLAAQMERF